MKNKLILLLTLVLVSLVSAQPPFQVSNPNIGITVEYQKINNLKLDSPFQINVHAFNSTDGLRLTNLTTDCELQTYYSNGSRSIVSKFDYNAEAEVFYFDIPGEFFSIIDKGSFVFYCNSSNMGGFISAPVIITKKGIEITLGESIIEISLLVFFMLLFISFYYIKHKVDFKNWNKTILKKHGTNNTIKVILATLTFHLMNHGVVIYYLLGFPILLMVTSMAHTYNIIVLMELMKVLMFMYSWSCILVGLVFLSYIQEWSIGYLDEIKNMNWGFGNAK
jgi:hypothetical protein